MQKKLRALIMGATALTASFALAGTATAAGPNCGVYKEYSDNYCDSIPGWEKELCRSKTFSAYQACFTITANERLTAMEKQRLVSRLEWPGR
ncbi:hypothetical protein PV721_15430 [Streptomyces sp. MB09-01]|uniref:hypothetical protein n=1 Tax=Streptomyces sp. MB09-01 TaxID=3028666 RepID=UPI0029B7BF4D|nr:hypothetical protein [Streptomyces sp. MB09-01]MDX3535728.1 hypothetical protein [Streptomyces sp. MB09-01]